MKKAKGNASKVKVCKIQFAAQTNTAKQHGWKPKGQICRVKHVINIKVKKSKIAWNTKVDLKR